MSATDDRRRQLQGNLERRRQGIRDNLESRQQAMADKLVQTLADNLGPTRTPPTLRREEPRGAIPAGRGRVERNYQAPSNPSSGGGIASPLIEGGSASGTEPVLDRTYHAPREVVSSDGLFVWEVAAINTITLRDANNAVVEIKLAEPENPEP
ncbi:hypothetical protein LL270_10510 [Pseudomonas aestusnigri]|uniref:hypothetical protein n=1 Tax=Halopseudomonas aestusnigri TaxID=857252 RepID=UPI001D19357D|nr:hypothetical protein [Halopseudomonas aestusnigri]MCC4261085.1 hypothetical protein [Halopseudomonas aestusnigri]